MAFGDAHASTPPFVKATNAGNDVTTASFTPPAGALLIAFAWHDTAGGNVTNTSQVTDSQGLTWTRQATRSKQDDGVGAANSHIAISTAVVASSVAMTVTTTGTNCNDPAGLYCLVLTDADTTTPMDATPVEGTTNAAVVSTSITTVTDGARCFLMVIDWNVAAAMTAGTAQTAIISDTIGTAPDDRIYLGVTNAVTSPAGSTTLSTGSPSTGNTQNWIGIAVRPAAGGGSVTGTAAAALGGLTATAAGQRTVLGTAAAALGGLTAGAAGQRTVFGAAAAQLGGLTAAAAGTRTVTATAAAPLGALAATAAGQRTVTGVAAATLGGLTGSAAGPGMVTGTAAATLGGLSATAAGLRTVLGVASAALGGLTATAVPPSAGMVGEAHGPLPLAVGSITVHTVSIAGAVT